MSILRLQAEVNKVAGEINASNSMKYLYPIVKIIKMRYNHLETSKIREIAKQVLN